jgi:chemotaxis protein CheX
VVGESEESVVHSWAMGNKTIDVQLLNPFITATLDCLTQMAGMKPQRKRVFVKNDPYMHGQISGVIGMSNGITGSCTVSFPMGLAKHIVAKFLGETEANLSDEMVSDGIGEVANMVAGGAKRIFATTGYKFDISTPTIIMGTPTAMYNPADIMSIACEFLASPELSETFIIDIALKPTDKK